MMGRFTERRMAALDEDHDCTPRSLFRGDLHYRCPVCRRAVHFSGRWKHGATLSGASRNARLLEEEEASRAEHLRRKRAYGQEGLQKIEELASRLWSRRPGVPEDKAYAWDEKVYKRDFLHR